jgi:hypothetical protein
MQDLLINSVMEAAGEAELQTRFKDIFLMLFERDQPLFGQL